MSLPRAVELTIKKKFERLLRSGADVNGNDDLNGRTALIQAVYHGRIEIAELLVRSNADVNVKNMGGKTALEFC